MSQLELIPCEEYDGIKWPTFISFRTKGAERVLEDVMAFQSKETDILICTSCKSGTHWIFEITKMLLNNAVDFVESKGRRMLEMIPDLSELDSVPAPRVLFTHVPFQYLPKKHIENKGKIVHIVRNPKDVMVSFYHHAQHDKFVIDLKLPWNEYFEVWMSGKIPYGSWYDYELGMEQAENDNPGIMYTCSYEEMKKDPVKEIKKLADYLEVDCSDQTIEGIAKASSFDNMQKNKFDATSAINNGKGFIYRKGEIGDWKNHFTVAQNERFDEAHNEKMKNSKYTFSFE